MSGRTCQHCGKGIMRGHKVSHAKQRTKKIYRPNLHWQKVVIKGVKKRLLLCTKCVRKLKRDAKLAEEKQAVQQVKPAAKKKLVIKKK